MISCQFFTRRFVFFAILQCFHLMVNSAPAFNCTKIDADCIVKTADKDKDGVLNFEEGDEFMVAFLNENERKTKDERLAEMKKMDLNQDGFLSAAEIDPPKPKVIIDRALLPKVKPQGTASVYCLLNYADKNNDGVLDYEEALILVEVPNLTKEQKLAEIGKLDLNHDGFLSASEMDPSEKPLPNGITIDLYCVTNGADKNYDGVLSFEEAYQYLIAFYGEPSKNKSKDEILAELKKLDLNQDGVLSASEIFPVPQSLPKSA